MTKQFYAVPFEIILKGTRVMFANSIDDALEESQNEISFDDMNLDDSNVFWEDGQVVLKDMKCVVNVFRPTICADNPVAHGFETDDGEATAENELELELEDEDEEGEAIEETEDDTKQAPVGQDTSHTSSQQAGQVSSVADTVTKDAAARQEGQNIDDTPRRETTTPPATSGGGLTENPFAKKS